MSTVYELPKVGEAKWHSDPNDTDASIDVGGHHYWRSTLGSMIKESSERLARLLAAQEFVAAESEKSRLDCAGERAFAAECRTHVRGTCDPSWDEMTQRHRDHWIAIAKAVLDGEH